MAATLNPFATEFVPRTSNTPKDHRAGRETLDATSVKEDRRTRADAAAPDPVPDPPVAASLKGPADLDALLKSDTSCLEYVTFERDFDVRDEHIVRLVETPQVGQRLTSLRLGSSDTGNGTYITDAAVERIADKCPNLEVLQLASCVQVSKQGFLAVTERLAKLRELHCTGHDRSSGSLPASALDPLLKSNALPQLRRLYVTDQRKLGYELIHRLIKKRPGLKVLAGETDSDSMAWGMVMQQMGRTYGDGLYGNMDGVCDPYGGLMGDGDDDDDGYGAYDAYDGYDGEGSPEYATDDEY